MGQKNEETTGKSTDRVDWEARYRARLKQELVGQEPDRFSPWARPSAEVYLPRTLLEEQLQPESEPGRVGETSTGRDGGERARPTLIKVPVKELWKKLESDRVLLVEGPAGMGKTTWSTHLVKAYLDPQGYRSIKIPIRIVFRDLVAEGGERASVKNYLTKKYDHGLGEWLYIRWGSNQAVLILDGLDEVVDSVERTEALKHLLSMGTRPLTILTSRPLGHSLPLLTAKIELQGLSTNEQVTLIKDYQPYLERLYQKQIDIDTFLQRVGLSGTKAASSSPVRSLLERPGHLVQLLEVYAKTGDVLETETEVLTHLLTARLTTTGRSHTTVMPTDADHLTKKRLVLETMAFHLLACRQGHSHSRAQLLGLVEQVLHEHDQAGTPLFPLTQASSLLTDFIQHSGLLTRVGFDPERFQMESVVWLHHLAGSALANRQIVQALNWTEAEVVDYLDKKAWDSAEWEPVLKSWVGQADNPFPLFERLMDKTKDDLARHRLGTAGRCLRELPARLREQASVRSLRDRIALQAFERWKRAAKQGTEKLITTSLRGILIETDYWKLKLIDLLKSKEAVARRKAIETLGMLGREIPASVQQALMGRLNDRNVDMRRAAMEALSGLEALMPEEVQDALLAKLTDSDEIESIHASLALRRLGGAMPERVQKALLVQMTELPDRAGNVGTALCGLGTKIPKWMQEALLEKLEDHDPNVRMSAIKVLSGLGGAMPERVQEALVAQLTEGDSSNQESAVWALWHLGAAMPDQVQKALLSKLDDPNPFVRVSAAMAPGVLGAAGLEQVQEALLSHLEDQGGYVLWAATRVFMHLGAAMPQQAQALLLLRLADRDSQDRSAVIEALGGLGEEMSERVQEALLKQLSAKSERVRITAMEALGRLGGTMPERVQKSLLKQLTDVSALEAKSVASALFSAQQQGLRFFYSDCVPPHGQLASDLSAIPFFSDGCVSHEPVRRSFDLVPLDA